MADNEQKEKPGNSGTNNYVRFTGIGFQMIAVIGIFAFAGHKIDQATHHTTQWVTALMSLIGVFIAMYTVIKAIKE